ncbi:MAG: hypothetical protein ACTSRG_22365 [Candidatus Helarchaeota archaeon]
MLRKNAAELKCYMHKRSTTMNTIFTINNSDFVQLAPIEAVKLFRELLWAEARRLGVDIKRINISCNINVPDSGIDATVQDSNLCQTNDLIKFGTTKYQIKAGATFKPWQDSTIKRELFGNKHPSVENLKAQLKQCFDNGYTYVLVCFKQDLTDEQTEQAKKCIKYYLNQCGYKNPKIEVWSQNVISGFLNLYPSLILKMKRRDQLLFQTHYSWSLQDDMKKVFKEGHDQKEFIKLLQSELRKNEQSIHIRIFGEPGIGKTRLILEATRTEDLSPLVCYCSNANTFKESNLFYEIIKEDNQFTIILVVDECDQENRAYIWNKLKHQGSRIKIITIYHEFDDTSGNIIYLDTPPLDEESINQIIQSYGVAKHDSDRWASLCGGSPRVAHVIGWNLMNNPDDLLKAPDTNNVWDRYIISGDDATSIHTKQKRLVLEYIALFKKFGFGRSFIEESRAISNLINQNDPQITWAKFNAMITELRKVKILQGEKTLYITPKALHIKLWIDWWNTYGIGFDFDEFQKNLPPQLLDWFYSMFKYASESQFALAIVEDMLNVDGLFKDGLYLKTTQGARFFLNLTEADPGLALECLKKTVGELDKKSLLAFTTGRREIIWALEKIVIWKEYFYDAAKLLLALGEAENESWSNNASGVFASLFSSAYGRLAVTETPPQERLPIIYEAIESESKEKRLLGLDACKVALETRNFTRSVGAEYQGLKRVPDFWMPKSKTELIEYYREVWNLLNKKLDDFQIDEKEKAIDIILYHTRNISSIAELTDTVILTLYDFIKRKELDNKLILKKVIEILHYDGKSMSVEYRGKWEKLRDSLVGKDFSSLIRRYVGLDLLEDHFDEDGNQVDMAQPKIEELAQETINNHSLLLPELPWLMSSEPQKALIFGYEVGKRDSENELIGILLEAQIKAGAKSSAFFLGGYFRAIYENDIDKWENALDLIANDKQLRFHIPELTWRSGMTDNAAKRIITLAQKGAIKISHFRMFCLGGVVRNISKDIFNTWIRFLLNANDVTAAFIAADLFNFYYISKKSNHNLPKKLTLDLLIHPSFYKKRFDIKQEQLADYHWTEIAKKYIDNYPKLSLPIAEKMLEHLGEDNTIFDGFMSSTLVVITLILKNNPTAVWDLIKNYFEPPLDVRGFHIREWLRGVDAISLKEEGALKYIPQKLIWQWVDEDVDNRAWFVASFVPKNLHHDEGRTCFAREILVRYGERDDVRNNLYANFGTEGWTGPESLHYQSKKDRLLEFRSNEKDMNVINWIDDYIKSLDKQIEQSKENEEREF